MDIRLMAYIKNQAVFHCIKHSFNGNRQFHNTQISGQMAAGARNVGDQEFPDLLTQLPFFFVVNAKQIIVTMDVF